MSDENQSPRAGSIQLNSSPESVECQVANTSKGLTGQSIDPIGGGGCVGYLVEGVLELGRHDDLAFDGEAELRQLEPYFGDDGLETLNLLEEEDV